MVANGWILLLLLLLFNSEHIVITSAGSESIHIHLDLSINAPTTIEHGIDYVEKGK